MTNIEEKTRQINEFRIQSGDKTFSRHEMIEFLKEISRNTIIINGLLTLFPHQRFGRSVVYSMPKAPIHMNFVKAMWEKSSNINKNYYQSNKKINLNEAVTLLQSKGYEIRKVVQFDVERFASENPTLYKKYLIYETI